MLLILIQLFLLSDCGTSGTSCSNFDAINYTIYCGQLIVPLIDYSLFLTSGFFVIHRILFDFIILQEFLFTSI